MKTFCEKCCSGFKASCKLNLQGAQEYFLVSAENVESETKMGKRISQIALYNQSHEFELLKHEL